MVAVVVDVDGYHIQQQRQQQTNNMSLASLERVYKARDKVVKYQRADSSNHHLPNSKVNLRKIQTNQTHSHNGNSFDTDIPGRGAIR